MAALEAKPLPLGSAVVASGTALRIHSRVDPLPGRLRELSAGLLTQGRGVLAPSDPNAFTPTPPCLSQLFWEAFGFSFPVLDSGRLLGTDTVAAAGRGHAQRPAQLVSTRARGETSSWCSQQGGCSPAGVLAARHHLTSTPEAAILHAALGSRHGAEQQKQPRGKKKHRSLASPVPMRWG